MDGPPATPEFQKLFGLTDEQAQRYGQVYDSFMVATKPQRDSAVEALRRVLEARKNQDAAAFEYHGDRLKRLAKYLRDRQEKFDRDLETFLTKPQIKDYKDWRKADERARERPRRSRFDEPPS